MSELNVPVSSHAVPRSSTPTRSLPRRRYSRLTSVISISPRSLGRTSRRCRRRRCRRSRARPRRSWTSAEPASPRSRRRAGGVELDHAVALGVGDMVGEDRAAVRVRVLLEVRAEPVAVEDVVAEDHRHGVRPDEVGADDEGVGEAARLGLRGELEAAAELRAVPEQPPELLLVDRRGDDQDLPDARHHQRRQGVVDHRLVVDGHQLLADALGDRVQPRAGPAGEHDPLHRDGASSRSAAARTSSRTSAGSSTAASPASFRISLTR